MADISVIIDRKESLRAFQSFESTFAAGADLFPNHYVGWQGGSVQVDVYWHRSAGIWGVFQKQPPDQGKGAHRFWNCFGIADPGKNTMLSITVEMNPPHEGEDRRTAGVFLRDEAGSLYVGHSGKVGGGRPGIGQQTFRKFSPQLAWKEVGGPQKGIREIIVFGPLHAGKLPSMLAPFVRTVANFKETVTMPR